MVAVLVVFYMLFQALYIECQVFGDNIAKCRPLDVTLLFSKGSEEVVNRDGTVLAVATEKRDDGVTGLPLSRLRVAARYTGRNMWVFTIFASTALGIAVLIIASFLIHKSASFYRETALIRISVLLVFSSVLGGIFWSRNFMPILEQALRNTVENGHLGIESVGFTMRLIIVFTFVATFALIFATCAILLPRKAKAANGNLEEKSDRIALELQGELDTLSGQMADLRVMLSAATVFLVVSVLRLDVVYQWSLAFISVDAIKAADQIVSNTVTETGALFTLILAVVYLPAAFIIHRRAQLLVENAGLSAKEREDILKDQKFTFSFKASLPRILTILGPVIAGPIGQLIAGLPPP
jgi:hypothetical protein